MSNDDTLYACQDCGITSAFPFFTDEIRARCAECETLVDWSRIQDGERADTTSDKDLFEETKSIVHDRENRHGTIIETHQAIADMWTAWLRARYGVEFELTPSDAADMLNLFKDARKATGERNKDTYRDAMGYDYCGWECRKEEDS